MRPMTSLAIITLLVGCTSPSTPSSNATTDAGEAAALDGDAGVGAADRRRHDAGSTATVDASAIVSVDAGSSGGGTIWHPTSGTTWQWQLTGTIDTTVSAAMYDIDLVDAPQSVIDTLHAANRKVVCYFSAGTYENWRPDASQFPAAAIGSAVAGWAGENWLDTRNATVRTIMEARLDLAVAKHCDAVEPDNVDGYTNSPGVPLTSATQLDYNRFLATQAHQRGLSVGLKNDLDQVSALVASFDWALNEECSKYSECNLLQPFVAAGKAVFHCEYTTSCPAAVAGLSTILKKLALGAPRTVCP